MNDHRAEARISIQALEGKIRLHVPDQNPIDLSTGQLMTLDCGIHHDVEAVEESAFLLTVAYKHRKLLTVRRFTCGALFLPAVLPTKWRVYLWYPNEYGLDD